MLRLLQTFTEFGEQLMGAISAIPSMFNPGAGHWREISIDAFVQRRSLLQLYREWIGCASRLNSTGSWRGVGSPYKPTSL